MFHVGIINEDEEYIISPRLFEIKTLFVVIKIPFSKHKAIHQKFNNFTQNKYDV